MICLQVTVCVPGCCSSVFCELAMELRSCMEWCLNNLKRGNVTYVLLLRSRQFYVAAPVLVGSQMCVYKNETRLTKHATDLTLDYETTRANNEVLQAQRGTPEKLSSPQDGDSITSAQSSHCLIVLLQLTRLHVSQLPLSEAGNCVPSCRSSKRVEKRFFPFHPTNQTLQELHCII